MDRELYQTLLENPKVKLLLIQARIAWAMAELRKELNWLGLEPAARDDPHALSRWRHEHSPTKAKQEQAGWQLAHYGFLNDAFQAVRQGDLPRALWEVTMCLEPRKVGKHAMAKGGRAPSLTDEQTIQVRALARFFQKAGLSSSDWQSAELISMVHATFSLPAVSKTTLYRAIRGRR